MLLFDVLLLSKSEAVYCKETKTELFFSEAKLHYNIKLNEIRMEEICLSNAILRINELILQIFVYEIKRLKT